MQSVNACCEDRQPFPKKRAHISQASTQTSCNSYKRSSFQTSLLPTRKAQYTFFPKMKLSALLLPILPLLAAPLTTLAQAQRDAVPWERLNKNDSLLLILDLQVGLYGLARDFDPTLYYNAILAHSAIGNLFDLPVIMTTSAEQGPNGPLPREVLEMLAFFFLLILRTFARPCELRNFCRVVAEGWWCFECCLLMCYREQVSQRTPHQAPRRSRRLGQRGVPRRGRGFGQEADHRRRHHDGRVHHVPRPLPPRRGLYVSLPLCKDLPINPYPFLPSYHIPQLTNPVDSVWANVEASGTTTELIRDISNSRMEAAGVQLTSLFAIMCDLMRDWRMTPGAPDVIPWLAKYYPVYGALGWRC